MADFVKVHSGQMFSDDFKQNTLVWQLSPSDYYNLESLPSGLRIRHNKDYTYYTLQAPKRDRYTFYCVIDHEIFNKNDICGVVILANKEEYAECQSLSMDLPSGITNSQRWLDMVLVTINDILLDNFVTFEFDPADDMDEVNRKRQAWLQRKKAYEDFKAAFIDKTYKYIKCNVLGGLYTFYASHDGIEWIEVGNTTFNEAGRIGFFVYGTDDATLIANSHFIINQADIYENRFVTVTGIRDGMEFEIKSGNKVIAKTGDKLTVVDEGRLTLDTNTFPMPMDLSLWIYQDNKLVLLKDLDNVYGGDIITMAYNIGVYCEGKKINPAELFYLGTFRDNKQNHKVTVHNHEDFILTGIKVSLMAYSDYYDGAEPVLISLFDEANQVVDFRKEVVIPEIMPSESQEILFGLSDTMIQAFYNTPNSFRFKLIIE